MNDFPERRARVDRREAERRDAAGRRAEDARAARSHQVLAALWALAGALVVLFLFLVAVGGVDPDDAPVASVVALVLAIAWLAHAWRRVWGGGYSPVGDRERRGF